MVQFDRLFESKAESKAECGAYSTVVVFEARRGTPLDHDNNRMTYHEYQGMFDIALF